MGFSLDGSRNLIFSINSGLMQHEQQNGSSTRKITSDVKMHQKAPPRSLVKPVTPWAGGRA